MPQDELKALGDATEVTRSTPRMFAGSLDDSVSRNPWQYHTADLESLNRHLIENALFGPRLCARIGNILYHPPYFDALLNEEKSPLLPMIRSGFFQIQMRDHSINGAIASRLHDIIESTLSFVKANDWKYGSEIYNYLEKLDDSLESGTSKIVYNKNVSHIYNLLMKKASEDAGSGFQHVYQIWLARGSHTRNDFESIANKKFTGDPAQMRQAMWVANSVNHCAFGVGAAMDSQSDGITVETMLLGSLVRECMRDEPIKFEAAQEIRKRAIKDKLSSVIAKNLNIPRDLASDPKAWAKLASLVDERNTDDEAKLFILDIIKAKYGRLMSCYYHFQKKYKMMQSNKYTVTIHTR